jgi:hypothetical protein
MPSIVYHVIRDHENICPGRDLDMPLYYDAFIFDNG